MFCCDAFRLKARRRSPDSAGHVPFTRRLAAAVCVALLAVCHGATAAGPEVTALLPAGGQRGTTVEVTASGKFPAWPVQAWVDRSGLTVSPTDDKGKLSVIIAADAAPGTHWLRLFDAEGASPPLPLVVGTLGEIVEKEPNNAPQTAQQVGSAAVVVNGRLGGRDDVDTFATTLQKGQTLVASLAAHETLGSPVDAVMHVVSADGFQLAYNHDQRGLDPEIVFTAPGDGTYLVRVFGFPSEPNSTIGFAGGDAYVYRLTLTTAGFVDYPWPLAATRDRETPVQLAGWNIPESLHSVTIRPADELAEIADPQLANVAALLVEPHETIIEAEPNEQGTPQELSLPVTVSGRIEHPEDVDAFSFTGQKDQPLVFQLQSRALGYPLDAVLQVFDAEGKSLARADDAGGGYDAELTFSPPADGKYVVVVTDLTRQGSPRHVYRLRHAGRSRLSSYGQYPRLCRDAGKVRRDHALDRTAARLCGGNTIRGLRPARVHQGRRTGVGGQRRERQGGKDHPDKQRWRVQRPPPYRGAVDRRQKTHPSRERGNPQSFRPNIRPVADRRGRQEVATGTRAEHGRDGGPTKATTSSNSPAGLRPRVSSSAGWSGPANNRPPFAGTIGPRASRYAPTGITSGPRNTTATWPGRAQSGWVRRVLLGTPIAS